MQDPLSMMKLDHFLEHEKNSNANEPWSKLNKTMKLRKLSAFADRFSAEHGLQPTEQHALLTFFRDCMDKKRLQRVKDVVYNKESGTIVAIPSLYFSKSNLHFTLKNNDKHVSTLKGLGPKKTGTVKNLVAKQRSAFTATHVVNTGTHDEEGKEEENEENKEDKEDKEDEEEKEENAIVNR